MKLLRRRGPDPCDCRLCRPEPTRDAGEERAVRNVAEHGTHVVLVSDAVPCTCASHDHDHDHDAEPSGEPDLAYTVGLWHARRHPELLISGLPRHEVMHRSLNELSALVLGGRDLQPGELYEDVLSGVPVTVEELTPAAQVEHLTWAAWFARRDVPALQVVWPDLEGVFAWQGADPVLDERQPPDWRVPGPRSGALAPQPSWPFPVPRDRLAIACRHVADGEAPALYVQRDADPDRGEDWVVSCGEPDHPTAELVLVHLEHLVTRSPGLRGVADLRLDEWARRVDARSSWQRFRD